MTLRGLSPARRLKDARRVIEPVVVQPLGRAATATVKLPDCVDPGSIEVTLDSGGGPVRLGRLLADAVRTGATDIDRRRYVAYGLDLDRLASTPLEPGYYRLGLESGDEIASSLLLVASTCPVARRGWGAFIPVHALRSDKDWGVGSYTEMSALGRFVAGFGASMLGCLPLYPSFYDAPADPSPYRPVSRLAYNELFVDPTALPEMDSCDEARRLVSEPGFVEEMAATHRSLVVDYELVAKLRRRVLQAMSRTVLSGPVSPRRHLLEAFASSHPELVAYARFRAERDTTPGTAGSGTDDSFGYHLYCQWAAFEQLSAAGAEIGLYADVPIGVHPDGFDPFWSPTSFLAGVHGGAPPDAFFASGQDWGFAPLHPDQIRDDGYSYVRAALARAFRHADYVRIDHVMGLQRLYMIPDGFDARHGAYVSYRPEEMHALVVLEAERAGTVVVGEDLGTVAEEVRERMAADKMLRSWVFQFESSAEVPLPAPPIDVLASLGTHDLPRFGTFLWGGDIDEKEASGELPAADAAAPAPPSAAHGGRRCSPRSGRDRARRLRQI